MAEARGAALVTGGATRIGRAIALGVAELGFDVAIHYRRSETAAEEVVREVGRAGRRGVALQADLADAAASAGLLARATERLGPVRLLVNNAAIFEFDRPDSVTAASWSRHMAVNLHAPFLLAQALARALPPDQDGQIVNLIDQRVRNPTPNYTSYTVSKFALFGLTRHLALALAPRIRVNAIGPGVVLPAPGMRHDAFDDLAGATPLRRPTAPTEIAGAVRFLILTPSITGEMLTLDSGMHLGWLHPGQPTGAE